MPRGRASLPCPLRSQITGGEASFTAFSIALGGKATLTVTPQSDGTVLVVRTGQLSAGLELGPSAGIGGRCAVRGRSRRSASARASRRRAAGCSRIARRRAASSSASLRDELDTRRWPPTWETVDSGREVGAWAGTRLGWKDKGGFRPATVTAIGSHVLGLKETRDGALTVYARVALDSAEVSTSSVCGRSAPTAARSGSSSTPARTASRSSSSSAPRPRRRAPRRSTDVAARLDLRDPANMAVARPFLESPATWLTGGGRGKRAVLDRIATHGIVERWVSTSEDHSRGMSLSAKLGFKFSVGGKKIKLVRHLIEATATVGGGLTGKRLDCLPGAASAHRHCGQREVAGDVPGPELDEVAVGVVEVGGAGVRARREGVLGDLRALGAQVGDGGVVVGLGDVHGEVDVDAAAAALEADLGLPEADPRAVAGHHPDRVAVGPAVDDRQAEQARVERLGGLEVDDFEDEFADTGDRNSHGSDSADVRRYGRTGGRVHAC